MAVTIKEVSIKAGVSPATVSMVINKKGNISEKTKAKVIQVIKELNYTPNMMGRMLSSKKTNNIVFFTTFTKYESFNNPHMFEIMIGIKERLSQNNYNVIFDGTDTEDKAISKIQNIIDSKIADAIIIHGFAKNKEVNDFISQSQFPYILIGKPVFRNKSNWIDISQLLAGEIAAKHLWAKQYRNIAFVGGFENENLTLQRYRGADFYLSNFNARIDTNLVKFTDGGVYKITQAVNELLAAENRPDAIICESNNILFTTIEILKSRGIKIPQDIAVIGFDKYPLSTLINPKPTVVDLDVYSMGYDAADFVLNRINNKDISNQTYNTSPTLILGETT